MNEFAIAYYAGQSDRDYIVLGKTGEQAAHTALHEYSHLVLRHAGYRLPPWLNEGLAEYFSTTQTVGGDTTFGDIIPGRLQQLRATGWVPLATILAADQDSPYYNEGKRAGSLYNQGWALTHMLFSSPEYSPKFQDLLNAIQNGTPSAQALEQVYGKPLAKIEEELQFYIRGSSFFRRVAKIKLENIDKLPSTPASLYDVRLLQGDLWMSLKDHQDDARKRFEELGRRRSQAA
ncbi:MAG: hypothetical protein WDO18_05585 [Acidobacteriota bacterium]